MLFPAELREEVTIYVGCYHDSPGDRDLEEDYLHSTDLTIEMCINYCRGNHWLYAAVQVYLKASSSGFVCLKALLY